MNTTRRRLLAFGVGGTALLVGGGALSFFALGYDDRQRRAALSKKEAVVVRAIVEALYPAAGVFPAGVDVGVVERIDEELFAQPAHVCSDLKAGIQLLEHAPPLLGRMARLSSLAVDERAAMFELLLQRGPQVVVQAAAALKQLSSLAYYGDQRVWGALGYDGPWQQTPLPPSSHQRWLAAVGQAA
ncbi:MAG TPA: hypothetical protein VGF99_05805 [Myxococcota bacterium]